MRWRPARPASTASALGLEGLRVTSATSAPTLCCDGDLAETGRGLRLVDAYSLSWDYYRIGKRTVTWFECPPEPIA